MIRGDMNQANRKNGKSIWYLLSSTWARLQMARLGKKW